MRISTGVQTCALPIWADARQPRRPDRPGDDHRRIAQRHDGPCDGPFRRRSGGRDPRRERRCRRRIDIGRGLDARCLDLLAACPRKRPELASRHLGRRRRVKALLRAPLPLVALLSACAPQQPPITAAPPAPSAPSPAEPEPAAENAVSAGVRPGPALAMLAGWRESAAAALNAFRISCPALTKRTDRSGLTTGEDWRPACAAAAEAGDPALFFEQHFETAVIGSGEAFLTGYYEPEILGARTPGPGYAVPVYKRPADLVDVEDRKSTRLNSSH